jgi:phosphoglycolate phosphatase-like HAD superfamily hydrolase
MTHDVTDSTESLRVLIAPARFVLFDFDGPVCRLFDSRTAAKVVKEQVRWLEERGLHGLLPDGVRKESDPHAVLDAVRSRLPGSGLVAELEERLTRQELTAVASALPTAYADPLIRTWLAVGAHLAITTDTSACVVSDYLSTRGLGQCFGGRVYGRTQGQHPCEPGTRILRALAALAADPAAALMIGDSPTDFVAAQRAGVRFLGYAHNEQKAELLRAVGADYLVTSLQPLLSLVYASGGVGTAGDTNE